MRFSPPVRSSEQVEWDDLRGQLAAQSAVGLMLCGWLASWYLLDRPQSGLSLVLLAMALIGIGLWLWSRATDHPQQSAILLTALTLVSVCVAWYNLQLPALVYVFAIPMMLAALLLRTWTTLVVGACVWLVVYGPLAPPVVVDGSASALLILLCAFQVTVMRGVRKHLAQVQRLVIEQHPDVVIYNVAPDLGETRPTAEFSWRMMTAALSNLFSACCRLRAQATVWSGPEAWRRAWQRWQAPPRPHVGGHCAGGE